MLACGQWGASGALGGALGGSLFFPWRAGWCRDLRSYLPALTPSPSEGRARSGMAEPGRCRDQGSCGGQQRGQGGRGRTAGGRGRLRSALHVQARCRTGSRNHIKVVGAQAGAGGDPGRVQHRDKNPGPTEPPPWAGTGPGPGRVAEAGLSDLGLGGR